MDLSDRTIPSDVRDDQLERSLLERLAWLDQQGFYPQEVNKIIAQVRELMSYERKELMFSLLALALALGLRADPVAASHIYEGVCCLLKPKEKHNDSR